MRPNIKEALDRAMAICSRMEKAKSDIRQNLTRWGISLKEEQDVIIDYLVENNFINESRFSNSYVRDKHMFNRWGKVKIRNMLKSKSIDDSVIEEALNSINIDNYFETLKEELIKKRKSIKASNQYDLKAKLMRFASSKGYETDLIYRAVDEILAS